MLTVATCFWDANEKSFPSSRCFDESWVEKLYRNFRRHLTRPFRFVCFTERERKFKEPIAQERLERSPPDYGCYIEPFRLDGPMIIAGLDTVIVANIDKLADYCLTGDKVALPRDPKVPDRSINAIALVPKGCRYIYENWRGENDMDWLRQQPWKAIDDLWRGRVISYKCHNVGAHGTQNAWIVYLHGGKKQHVLSKAPWVAENWR